MSASESVRRKVLLVGHGRMGRLVESLAGEYGFDVAGIVGRHNAGGHGQWAAADVAIDFSLADAVPENVSRLVVRGTPVVIGTTGWQAHEAAVRDAVARHGSAVVAAPNFSIGVNMFLAMVERAGELMAGQQYGAWIHELHHAAKRDAPSGTAIALKAALERGGFSGPLDVASTRAGAIPGTHTVGFDAPADTITLTHTARDRTGFARGALQAAQWVIGRKGWFSMRDVLGA